MAFVKFRFIIFTYKILVTIEPAYLYDKFEFASSRRSRNFLCYTRYLKNGYIVFVEMYRERRHLRSYKEHIFLIYPSTAESIYPYLSVRLSVCTNKRISETIRGKETKFGTQISIYPTQIKFVSNLSHTYSF